MKQQQDARRWRRASDGVLPIGDERPAALASTRRTIRNTRPALIATESARSGCMACRPSLPTPRAGQRREQMAARRVVDHVADETARRTASLGQAPMPVDVIDELEMMCEVAAAADGKESPARRARGVRRGQPALSRRMPPGRARPVDLRCDGPGPPPDRRRASHERHEQDRNQGAMVVPSRSRR